MTCTYFLYAPRENSSWIIFFHRKAYVVKPRSNNEAKSRGQQNRLQASSIRIKEHAAEMENKGDTIKKRGGGEKERGTEAVGEPDK